MDWTIGFFHIDIAEVRTAEGELSLFVAIDRTSKFAFVELHEKGTTRIAADFLIALTKAVPYKIHTVLTDNGTHFTDPGGETWTPAETEQMLAQGRPFRAHAFELACVHNDIDHRLTKPKHPWTGQVERMNRTIKDATVKTIFLRNTWGAARSSGGFRHRIQFRTAAQDPQRPHAIRIHLQALDKGARQIHTRSAPSNAGTKYLTTLASKCRCQHPRHVTRKAKL